MKIDLTQEFENADGTVAKLPDGKVADLKHMLVQALLLDVGPNGQPVPNDEKVRRYELYRAVRKARSVIELTAEDVAFLKAAVKPMPTLVVGQVHEMLERQWIGPPKVVEPAPSAPPRDPDDYRAMS